MQIASRDDLPALLNRLDLIGFGAEVGVYDGAFSWYILREWKGARLYSVDPWQFQSNVKLDLSNVNQKEHDEAYASCCATLTEYGQRSKILREFSVNAAAKFQDGFLDFVYIDARHDYRSVTADLNAWYPKVKVGGIIAGHDYKDSFIRKNLVEVKRAADNFFFMKERVWVTTDDNLPSFYVIKQKEN